MCKVEVQRPVLSLEKFYYHLKNVGSANRAQHSRAAVSVFKVSRIQLFFCGIKNYELVVQAINGFDSYD